MSEPSAMMAGFLPIHPTPEAYILGITRQIWEDRDVASLNHNYAPDVIVRMPGGVSVGNQGVIASTMASLAEMPDRMLYGEDVIWSESERGGFLSSHRLACTATHMHDGSFGPATGKRLAYRAIADCAAIAGVIDDEWLIRDQGAIVRQMGWEPKAFAADQIAREGGAQACKRPLSPATDVVGPYRGRGNDHPIGARYGELLTRIMAAELSVIPRDYDRAVQMELPGARTGHGHAVADSFWLGLRAAFPSARFSIDHQIGRDDLLCPPRAALRWSLTGTHDGWGAFGPPSGAEVHVMGLSHAEFGPWGLKREFILLDEIAVWKQILLKTG
jgi:hypothetical protein